MFLSEHDLKEDMESNYYDDVWFVLNIGVEFFLDMWVYIKEIKKNKWFLFKNSQLVIYFLPCNYQLVIFSGGGEEKKRKKKTKKEIL